MTDLPEDDAPKQLGSVADGDDVSRREFARLTGVAALGALLPGLGSIKWLPIAVPSPKATARIVSEATETLQDGAVRYTAVVEYEHMIPPALGSLGWSGRQTNVMTKRLTKQGDVIEHEISYSPPLPTADGKITAEYARVRAEFVHGPIRGNRREDSLTYSIEIGALGGATRGEAFKSRVLRPIDVAKELNRLSSQQQLQLAIDMFNKHGEIDHTSVPGTLRVIEGPTSISN